MEKKVDSENKILDFLGILARHTVYASTNRYII